MKFNKLLKQDFKIVENKAKAFIAPAIIVAIALIFMIIYGAIFKSPFNLGMDFAGGYNVSVTLGAKISDKNDEKIYKNKIVDIIEGLKDEEGKPYKIHVSSVQKQGSGETAAILVRYKAVRDEIEMEEVVNKSIYEKLTDDIFLLTPEINYGDTISATYELPLNEFDVRIINNKLTENGFAGTASLDASNNKIINVALTSPIAEDKKADFVKTMTFNDNYAGKVTNSGLVSATVSSELLMNAISATIIAIVCMLIYIAIRFKFLSGVSAVIALFHDILIMFCGMIIFHIELNSTFIAALITILGYSINNTIVIFDRVRENIKMYGRKLSASTIANRSVQETIWRSINTTITTLITITMVALIGVPDIKVFALPIIFGLLAGTYSSIFIAPSIWAGFRDKFPERNTRKSAKAKAPKKAK